METNLDTEGLNIMVKFSEVISWIKALAVRFASPMAGNKLRRLPGAVSSYQPTWLHLQRWHHQKQTMFRARGPADGFLLFLIF